MSGQLHGNPDRNGHDAVRAGRSVSSAGRTGTALVVSYPLLAHAATLLQSGTLTLASVIVLAAAVLLPGLLASKPAAWLGAAAAAVAIPGLARIDATALVLFLPPVLINAYLAWLFGRTLAAGRTPLIGLMVRMLHGAEERLDASISRYATRLTAAWTLLFVALGLVNLTLALLAKPGGLLIAAGFTPPAAVPRETWSLFANVLNYIIVGVFFLAEYAYRRRRFPQQPYRNIVDFLRRAIAVAPAMLANSRGEVGQARR